MNVSMEARRETLKSLLGYYYDRILSNYTSDELEIRFGGSNKFRRFTKIDYDNVAEHLYACGFSPSSQTGGHGKEGMQSLRIYTEYQSEGKTLLSKVRAEIDGIDAIRDYCTNNEVKHLIDKRPSPVRFVRKLPPYSQNVEQNKRVPNTVFYEEEYNAKIVHQSEGIVNYMQNDNLKRTVSSWKSLGKMYRHMNRTRFAHPTIPIFIDMSIVKTNKMTVVKRGENNFAKRALRPTDIQSAGIFDPDVSPVYEIEVELNNAMLKQHFIMHQKGKENGVNYLLDLVRRSIQLVVGGLQQSFYPITYVESRDVINAYATQIQNTSDTSIGINAMDDFKPNPRLFIGPNSVTLQLENVKPTPGIVNIQDKYCVTEKADGQRAILYIHQNCKIYLIDMNMNVKFTGLIVPDTKWAGIMLDGEHIRIIDPKSSVKQDIYAAFDIYFYRAQDEEGSIVDTRTFPFINLEELTEKEILAATAESKKASSSSSLKQKRAFRLPILQIICQSLNDVAKASAPAHGVSGCHFNIRCKRFEVPLASRGETIFTLCRRVLDANFEYGTDGLIFTPCHLGVGMYDVSHEYSSDIESSSSGSKPPNARSTWELSFKWKPPLMNTIDFWVRVEKDSKTGKEVITNKMVGNQVVPYKTLTLCCTFDTTQDEIAEPFRALIQDSVKRESFMNNGEGRVKGMPFIPTQPYDRMAPFCYQKLNADNAGRKYMLTEEGQIFHDNTIVEFQYLPDEPPGMRWKPLRVRYDKTAQMLSTGNYFGNAFRVANANWHSIHYPVSQDVISGIKPISDVVLPDVQDETETEMMDEKETDIGKIYYKRKSIRTLGEVSYTVVLRQFHNYVKAQLIQYAKERSGTNALLIDYAVGKAGDLHKWQSASLQFVLGIDISKDNIENTRDGACVRYLREYYKSWERMRPKCIFLQGNSGLSITDGAAFDSTEHRDIAAAVFGSSKPGLGQAVAQVAGIAKDGFHISSCQFAIHYFFSDAATLHSFMRNVSQCTRMGGFFIGTCLDGQTVFDKLQKTKNGQIGFTYTDEHGEPHLLLEIQRKYTQEGFPSDIGSLGYPIRVFQETIGQFITEYLVNFRFLRDIMGKYGFDLVEEFDNTRGNGSRLFDVLYNSFLRTRVSDARTNVSAEKPMSDAEKTISFMNRYFVFQKKRDPDEGFLKTLDIGTPKPAVIRELTEVEDKEDESDVDFVQAEAEPQEEAEEEESQEEVEKAEAQEKAEDKEENIQAPPSAAAAAVAAVPDDYLEMEQVVPEPVQEEEPKPKATKARAKTVKEPKEPKPKAVKEPKEPKPKAVKEPKEPKPKAVKEPKEPKPKAVKEPKEPKPKAVKEPKEPKPKVSKKISVQEAAPAAEEKPVAVPKKRKLTQKVKLTSEYYSPTSEEK
jgi:hypothetical protein